MLQAELSCNSESTRLGQSVPADGVHIVRLNHRPDLPHPCLSEACPGRSEMTIQAPQSEATTVRPLLVLLPLNS